MNKEFLLQIIFFLVSALCWRFAIERYARDNKKYFVYILPVFPVIMGTVCGTDYLSSMVLLIDFVFIIGLTIDFLKDKKSLLFIVSLLIVLLMTLAFRDNRGTAPVYVMPFWSILDGLKNENYGRLGHFLNNMILFVPLGVSTYLITGKKKICIAYGTILSCLIELSQFLFVLGESDIDDLIGNSLGTALGIIAVTVFLPKRRDTK